MEGRKRERTPPQPSTFPRRHLEGRRQRGEDERDDCDRVPRVHERPVGVDRALLFPAQIRLLPERDLGRGHRVLEPRVVERPALAHAAPAKLRRGGH
eukprot:1672955-Pleurochrysis_carterae.AAC.1